MDLLNMAIFGSFTLAIVFIALVFIAFIASEKVEHGGIAFLALVVFCVINYMWGNIPLLKLVTLPRVFLYLGIGFIFAIVRIYFFGRGQKNEGYSRVRYDSIKSNVFRWWFIWPASLAYWVFSSLLGEAWDWVYDKFESLFDYFLMLGFNSVKKKE